MIVYILLSFTLFLLTYDQDLHLQLGQLNFVILRQALRPHDSEIQIEVFQQVASSIDVVVEPGRMTGPLKVLDTGDGSCLLFLLTVVLIFVHRVSLRWRT